MKKLLIVLISLVSISAFAQLPGGAFSIGGGPTVGYQNVNFDDINTLLSRSGIPALKNGVVYFGGGGFIDIPFKSLKWLRIGGFGRGFSVTSSTGGATNTKSVIVDYGEGGISLDYVFRFGPVLDVTLGSTFGTGEYKINLHQNYPSQTWTGIGESDSTGSSLGFSRNLKTRVFTAQPSLGLGGKLAPFVYAKLNAGYLFSSHGDWKVEDEIVVTGVPDGVKPDGFNVNLTISVGLFFR